MVGAGMILSELETIRQVAEGKSLARFNDGELGYAFNNWPHRHQRIVGSLARRLRHVYAKDVDGLLIGMPRVLAPDNDSLPDSTVGCQKFWRQRGWQGLCEKLHKDDRILGSGFVSYPDRHVPREDWIRFEAFCESLWIDRDVCLVGQPKDCDPSHRELIGTARTLSFYPTPPQDAWRKYEKILEELSGSDSSMLFLISVGITGTVLAADLHAAGYHAVDIGRLLLRLKIMEQKSE
jgi:hypothetical protein